MTRRYGEPIDVRRRDDTPAQFLWRGRVYVVHDVLAHWVESRPWWVSAEPCAKPCADEREVWRVEAGAGRLHGIGVYDLRFDWFTSQWMLDRVVD